MNHPAPGISEEFTHRTGRPADETVLHRWDTTSDRAFSAPVDAPVPEDKVWACSLPVKSNRATMMIVELALDCGDDAGAPLANGYRTSFVVEWSGWHTMHFTAASLKVVGQPAGFAAVRRLRLTAGSATFGGTVLELGSLDWHADSPVVPVTPYEDMVVNFLAERMWDPRDWQYTGSVPLPAGDQALDVAWMYANLHYLQKPGRRHQTAYTRRMDLDISVYQAVALFTATDIRANFSLILEIDGVPVRAIDRRRGIGGGDEMRGIISGRRLTALTIELEQADAVVTEALHVHVSTQIRWILFERTGTDPAQVGQAWGIPPVAPPTRVEPLETGILPVGILIGREEFLRLREAAKHPGPLQKIANELIAESTAHWDYQPEQYAGRYLPVDLGNQGCERRVSPATQMNHVSSCMVYAGFAYAFTGDLRHGQTARRALFTAVRCKTWQGGFPSRIPAGLPGYRAPFIESDCAECVALCYDFIYPLLSAAERREVEDALYEKALPWIDMYLRLNGEGYLLNSNQGAVYTAGLAYAALVARRSHPDVDAILERGIAWFPRMMNNYFKPDGATNEGQFYWEFTTKHAVTALIAITRHKGWNLRDYAPAHLGRTMDYIMHTRSLARRHLSFLPMSDSIESFGYNFMGSSFLFFAKYYEDPNALWLWHEFFARRPNPPGSWYFGRKIAAAYTSSGLLDFLLYVDRTPTAPQLPASKRFANCDRITLRTGSSHGDILFLFEGGPQTFDHTHADKGQFILEAYGERFAADPGVIKYQDPACIFFKNTDHHNLVTLNGANQDYRDPKRAVVLDRADFGAPFDYLSADLRNSYKALAKYQRRIVFVRPHYFLVLDDAQADTPGLEWNYHTCAPITQVDLTAGLVRLQGENAAMHLAIGCLQPLRATTGIYASEGVTLTHNLVLAPERPAATLTLAALLLPFPRSPGASAQEPQAKVSYQGTIVTFTVTGPWGTDEVHCELSGTATTPDHPAIRIRRQEAGVWRETFTADDESDRSGRPDSSTPCKTPPQTG